MAKRGTSALIEFAVIQPTYRRSGWRDVVAVDSCHDVDVHLHRYSRSTENRVGEPETLVPVTCMSDLQRGYDLAYARVFDDWANNLQRWWDHG